MGSKEISPKKKFSDTNGEPREFLVDSGASMHLVPMKGLSDWERKNIKRLKIPIPLATANGQIQCNLWTYVRIHELDILVPALLLRDAPSLLSMGMLCKESGYKFEWDPDEGPSLQKKGGAAHIPRGG